MLILLPPSEAKTAGGDGVFRTESGTFGHLSPQRDKIISMVKERLNEANQNGADSGEAFSKRLFGASGTLLQRAQDAMFHISELQAPEMPAWRRYSGVVWQHLGSESLDTAELAKVLIPSALLGISSGNDPVPDYRLKMTAPVVPGIRLSKWWKEVITKSLVEVARNELVLDLLPVEHSMAVDRKALGDVSRLIATEFKIGAEHGSRAGGHAAKAVKGAFARAMLLVGPDAVAQFEWHGWTARWQNEQLIQITRN